MAMIQNMAAELVFTQVLALRILPYNVNVAGVYTRNRNFRLLSSTKLAKSSGELKVARANRFVRSSPSDGSPSKHRMENNADLMEQTFLDSLVCNVEYVPSCCCDDAGVGGGYHDIAAECASPRTVSQTPQPPPIAEFATGNLSAENPPEKLRRAELAAEFCQP